jgi:hypothetical protein
MKLLEQGSPDCEHHALQPTDVESELVIGVTADMTNCYIGRTVKMCMDMFNSLRSGQHHPYSGMSTIASVGTSSKRKSAPDAFEHLMTGPPPKRRQSGVENVPTTREIRPKASNGGSPNPASSIPTTQAKKRGRPSKADAERKQLEAIQRGEVIPPAHITPKSGQQLGEGVMSTYMPIAPTPTPTATPLTPQPMTQEQSPRGLTEKEAAETAIGDSPGKKKSRSRAPPKAPKVHRLGQYKENANKAPQQTLKPGESSFPVNPPTPQPRPIDSATQVSTVSVQAEAGPSAAPESAGQTTFSATTQPQPTAEPSPKSNV